jgi:hypothetical protein
MHKNAMKCNETLNKWCKNKHGASKFMDTLQMYHSPNPKSSPPIRQTRRSRANPATRLDPPPPPPCTTSSSCHHAQDAHVLRHRRNRPAMPSKQSSRPSKEEDQPDLDLAGKKPRPRWPGLHSAERLLPSPGLHCSILHREPMPPTVPGAPAWREPTPTPPVAPRRPSPSWTSLAFAPPTTVAVALVNSAPPAAAALNRRSTATRRLEGPRSPREKMPHRHLPWGAHGFASGLSGGGDAGESGWRPLEAAAPRVPPCRQRRVTRGWSLKEGFWGY